MLEGQAKVVPKGELSGFARMQRPEGVAAWCYRLPPSLGPALRKRQEGVSGEIKEIAWKARTDQSSLNPAPTAADLVLEKQQKQPADSQKLTRSLHIRDLPLM